jgi:hypothetical protein
MFQPAHAIVRRSEDGAHADRRSARRRKLLPGLQHGVAVVLGRPLDDLRFVAVVLDQIAAKLRDRPAHRK